MSQIVDYESIPLYLGKITNIRAAQGRSPEETARPVSYSRRHVGSVPVIEEHSAGMRFDPLPPQRGPAEDVPLGAAERLASLCHHDAILDLACLQVWHPWFCWYKG